jgi:hypothetical protein
VIGFLGLSRKDEIAKSNFMECGDPRVIEPDQVSHPILKKSIV